MTWDVDGKPDDRGEIGATRLSLGVNGDREVSAIDWGHDMVNQHFPMSSGLHADLVNS